MKYKKFKDLTVADYQQLYSIYKSDDEDTEKSVLMVSVLTGLPRWDVENISLLEFNNICREAAVILSGVQKPPKLVDTVTIKGKKYRVCLNPRKMQSGQYIDIQTFMRSNIIDNLHKIFACLLVPKKLFGKGKYSGELHEQVAEGVRDLNFSIIHGTCIFFLNYWKLSMQIIRDSLEKKMKKENQSLPKELMDLWKLSDGFITQNG